MSISNDIALRIILSARHLCKCIAKAIAFHWASLNQFKCSLFSAATFSINQVTDLLALLILLRPIQEHNQSLRGNLFGFAITILQRVDVIAPLD
jgi:hypothetical protein